MKKTTAPTPSSNLPWPWIALSLAASGQFFLSLPASSLNLSLGCSLYGAALLLFWPRFPKRREEEPKSSFPFQIELMAFFAILSLALFLRVYRLSEIPSGLTPETGCEGWGALEILNQGWRPFYEVYQLRVWDVPVYYPLAAWFYFFGATQLSLSLFFVAVSLAGFPLLYWTFRRLAGTPTALAALFILAVMRWDIMFSRNAHPTIQLPFYMFSTLAFWLYGLKSGKRWAFLAGAVFFSTGFYIYEAYKAFALLMPLLALYEYFHSPVDFKKNIKGIIPAVFLSLFLITPWLYMVYHLKSIGRLEEGVFIFPRIFHDGYLLPLLKHLGKGALAFNHHGDDWFLQNLPGHRMLDDVTGFFFVLGFFLALSQIRSRPYFYAFSGFLVMDLAALLTVNPVHAARSFGTAPFAALLAAFAVKFLWNSLGTLEFFKNKFRLPLVLALAMGWMTIQNFRVYFGEQAGNYDCWRGFSVEATEIGKTIRRLGGGYEYYLSPRFVDHFSVKFLAYGQLDHLHELGIYKNRAPAAPPDVRGLVFALDQGQTGVLNLLQSIYRGGETEFFRDPQGHSLLYFYKVPSGSVQAGRDRENKLWASNFGLTGTYRLSLDEGVPPALIHPDPLINFTFRNDFPVDRFPPLSVHWKGFLEAPQTGSYRFLALTTDSARMTLDGKLIFAKGGEESPDLALKKGLHQLDFYFEKSDGIETALSLLWKVPGAPKYDVIPYQAYRQNEKGGRFHEK